MGHELPEARIFDEPYPSNVRDRPEDRPDNQDLQSAEAGVGFINPESGIDPRISKV